MRTLFPSCVLFVLGRGNAGVVASSNQLPLSLSACHTGLSHPEGSVRWTLPCRSRTGGIGQRAIDPYFLCYCCRLLFPFKTKVHYHRLPNSKRFSLSLSAFCSSTQLSSDGRPFHLNTSTTKYVARNGQLTNGEQTPEDVAFITATKVLSIDRLIIFFWPAHDWRKRVKPRSRIE